ncbi:helix-turn-helix domain-containing protein [Agrilactobacillus fermenti]|uniref:helix-turn-helix domain-containing protein n=1 Tax=Agrilactobacillus fermenti TaxID=2586909 RepID=UPI0038B3FE83|nr:helix-turn-helix transcriptional regulator [Agrilactobacillus fermenti]
MENHLSRFVGEQRISITQLSKETGISRNTLTSIYYDRNSMIKFDVIEKLCDYFQVPMHELFDYYPKKEIEYGWQ